MDAFAPQIVVAKRLLNQYCRPLFQAVRRYRKARRERYDRWKGARMEEIAKAFVNRNGLAIQGGPFRGMNYTYSSMGSAVVPKLVGSYEAEVQPFLERYAAGGKAVRIVDIGCDEGYYVVGMARRMPSAHVYGFDINPAACGMCTELARINGVADRVSVEGACTHERLNELLRPGDLIVCDCEGYEYEILDPARAPALRGVEMIVELHDSDFLDLNITATLRRRFEPTHEIEIVTATRRHTSDWPSIAFLNHAEQRLALDEGRSLGQQWALMRPR